MTIQDRRRTRKLGKMTFLLLVIGFLCYILNPVRQTGAKVDKRENRAVSVPVGDTVGYRRVYQPEFGANIYALHFADKSELIWRVGEGVEFADLQTQLKGDY